MQKRTRENITIAAVILTIIGFIGTMQLIDAQPPSALDVQSPAPTAPNASAVVIGNTGINTYNYWVVANYPAGASISQAAIAQFVPTNLTSTNYVNVGWNSIAGATTYDVVRLTPPFQFNGSCTACAVATGVAATNVRDTGGVLANYAVSNFTSAANGSLYVNNRDYRPAQWRQIVNGTDLPIGSTGGAGATGATGSTGATGATGSTGATGGAPFGMAFGSTVAAAPALIADTGYFKSGTACTISSWTVIVNAGTATFDVWKVANGSAIPTNVNTITAAAPPTIASGTVASGSTLTGWTTAVAVGDIFGFNLKTVATATYAALQLYCN